ncbi:MAG: hypothetical protein J7455_18145 [Roseiflexus sp.]|jgi:hypothetical protein|nr:hypothetical protein [Roseiflexus sp.]MBO9366429.1 hypothetical protein [Roseiflexus sp.]MBO9382872.1 hypothetical protein [Roseiflexus sp.]MBO9390859.1 hypothetical protein [Roseiflexus sp.]
MQKLFVFSIIMCIVLAACGRSSGDTSLPAPAFVPLDVALATPRRSGPIGAYLLIDASGARLVAVLSFSTGATPLPTDPPGRQVWLDLDDRLADIIRRAQPYGNAQYLAVAVSGDLEGPGVFGPEGAFGYRMRAPTPTPLPWQETTVMLLAALPPSGQAVRVTGALVASASEAVLVEALNPGGVPAPQARQVKLRAPLRDAALMARLTAAPGGAVRYGIVQVEGIWHDGALVPMGIRKVEG